jgi:hypothetical protein
MNRMVGWMLGVVLSLNSLAVAQLSERTRLFDAPRYYHNSTVVDLSVAGDLDGDGDPDLVGFTVSPDGYEVWRNTGNFTFQRLPRINPAGDPYLGRDIVRLHDVNGDNQPDLIADTYITSSNQGLTVYPWVANNTFGSGILLSLPDDAHNIEFGDFNGDTVTDLVESHYVSFTSESFLQYWSWDGTTFVAHSLIDVTALGGTNSLAVIDYDGDGDDDVLHTNFADPQIHVFLNSGGTLSQGPTLAVASGSGYGKAFAEDLDGDTDLDILYVEYVPQTGDVCTTQFLNHGPSQFTQGPFGVTPNPNFKYDFYMPNLYPCDWDGDGDFDLVSKYGSVSFLENMGSAQYQFSGQIFTARNGETLPPVDIDGDGHMDFVEEDVIIIGDGTFKHYLMDDEELNLAHFGLPRDWDGDGDIDLLSNFGHLYKNDGTGVLDDRGNKWPTLTGGFEWGALQAVGDFNGDDRLDYLIDYQLRISPYQVNFLYVAYLRDNGMGGYTFVGPAAPVGDLIDGSFVADYDSDGDLDVLGPGTQWLNDGEGYFHPDPSPFPDYLREAGDVDGDQDLDYLTYDGTQICLQRDTGGLQFTSEVVFAVASMDRVELMDLDDDQDLDIAVLANFRQELYLLENANSSFSLAQSILGDSGSGIQPDSLKVADIDEDGRSDLIMLRAGWSQVFSNHIEVHFRQSGGIAYDSPIAWLGRDGLVNFADMDSDGDLDAVGRFLVRGDKYHGEEAGFIRQYRTGTPGTGGAKPVLGANGPTRPGSVATIRVRRGVGGTVGLLAVGLAESDIPGSPWPHTNSYCEPWHVFRLMLIGGATGEASAGFHDLTYPVLSSFAGLRAFHQVFLVDDAAPSRISSTGGLEILYGE